MFVYDKSFKIEGTLQSIFEATWSILKPHMKVMSLIWAVFYIPTNIFILLRSGDMVKHLNSGSSLVLPVILLLSLLGAIPSIALVLLVRAGDWEDYNALVGLSFRKIPYYVTTTLAMGIRMLPMVVSGIIISLFITLGLDSIGTAPELQLLFVMPIIVIVTLYAMLRYASAVPLYLMTGARNFRAARYSSYLFRMNRKKILSAFLICTFLPMALNFLMLFTVESETVNVVLGFILGYYMFLSTAFYAGFLNHIKEVDSENSLSDSNFSIEKNMEKTENEE